MSRLHVGILLAMLLILCHLRAFAQAPPKAYGPGAFDQRLRLNDAKASALQSDAATQSYF